MSYCKSYDFKFDLIFYNIPRKTSGKMLLKVYKNQVLELVVEFWLLKDRDFMLKKADNSKYRKTHN